MANNQTPRSRNNSSGKISAKDTSKPQPYAPSSYKLINKESIKIYSPNVISVKKRIISA